MRMLNLLLASLMFYSTDILNIKPECKLGTLYSLVHHLVSCSFVFKPLTGMHFKSLDNEFFKIFLFSFKYRVHVSQ